MKQEKASFGFSTSMLASLPIAVAVFGKRKALWYNKKFSTQFLSDKKALVTLGSILGRSNAVLTRELNSMIDAGKAGWETVSLVELNTREQSPRSFDLIALLQKSGDDNVLITIFRDVTEGQNSLAEVRREATSHANIVQGSSYAIAVLHGENFAFVNRQFLRLYELSAEKEIIGKKINKVIHAKGRRVFAEAVDALNTENAAIVRHEAVSKEGKRMIVESTVSYIDFLSLRSLLWTSHDVTLLKREEDEKSSLFKGRELLDAFTMILHEIMEWEPFLEKTLDQLIASFRFESGAVFIPNVQRTEMELFKDRGLPENIKTTFRSLSMTDGLLAFVSKTQEPSVLVLDAYPPFLPFKLLFESAGCRTILFVPLLFQNDVIAILFAASSHQRDVTDEERKLVKAMAQQIGGQAGRARSYSMLHDSETKYRTAIAEMNEVYYERSKTGVFSYISPAISRLIGYGEQEFYDRPDLFRNLLHPDDRTEYASGLTSWAHGQLRKVSVYRILPKGKASYSWIRDSVWYIRDSTGEMLATRGVLIDVTKEMSRINELENESSVRDLPSLEPSSSERDRR